jgi:transcriptional regulator with XRE-family HTH domain
MARAALQMTVREIEERTGVNKNTVSRYEAGKDILASALQQLEKLFLDAGVIFLAEDASGGAGIRLPARHLPRIVSVARSQKAKNTKRSQKNK